MRIAGLRHMPSELTEDARELLHLFAELPAEDRARILSLVRSLSICHTADALRKAPFSLPATKAATQGSGTVSMSDPVCDPCV
jgi:hypothetical protein